MAENLYKVEGRPMRLRSLRITLSDVSLIACILIVTFWARSYFWNDVYAIHVGADKFAIQSVIGRIWFVRALNTVSFHQEIKDRKRLSELVRADENVLGYHFYDDQYTTDFRFQFPHWWLVLLALSFAALPWKRPRFTLRTLLLGIALVAVALGVVVYGRH
jgi:hypothetical protein